MALQDKIQEETSERKNALEAYIYSLRNKLCDRLAAYVTSEESSDLSQKLEAAEVHHICLLLRTMMLEAFRKDLGAFGGQSKRYIT